MKQELVKYQAEESTDFAFVVVCDGFGFDKYTGKKISPKQKFACQTLQEASNICLSYIEKYNLGGSNWNDGSVYHPKLGKFARVSYNGRVWKHNTDVRDEFTEDNLLKTWDGFMPEIKQINTYDYPKLKQELLKLSL